MARKHSYPIPKIVATVLGGALGGIECWLNADSIIRAGGEGVAVAVALVIAASIGGLAALPIAEHAWKARQYAVTIALVLFFTLMGTYSFKTSLDRVAGGKEQAVATVANGNRSGELAKEGYETAKTSLAGHVTERAALQFVATDAAAVQAVQARATAAGKAKDAECSVRGKKCRDKEEAEAQVLNELAAVARNKALTDRAAGLDSQIERLRAQVEQARGDYAKAPVTREEDAGTATIMAILGVSAKQVRTAQSLLLPLAFQIGAWALVAFGLSPKSKERHAPAAQQEQQAQKKRKPRKRKKTAVSQLDGKVVPLRRMA